MGDVRQDTNGWTTNRKNFNVNGSDISTGWNRRTIFVSLKSPCEIPNAVQRTHAFFIFTLFPSSSPPLFPTRSLFSHASVLPIAKPLSTKCILWRGYFDQKLCASRAFSREINRFFFFSFFSFRPFRFLFTRGYESRYSCHVLRNQNGDTKGQWRRWNLTVNFESLGRIALVARLIILFRVAAFFH